MKKRDDQWGPGIGPVPGPGPEFVPPGPAEESIEERQPDAAEPVSMTTVRRIEYIGRLHHMAFRSVLAEDALPPAQVQALKVIIHSPGMSQRELSDRLRIQRATTTVMLQKMEKAGYIDRRADPMDQRIYRIYPTEAALAMEEQDRKLVDSYFARVIAGIDEAELDTLNQLLARLGTNLRSVIQNQQESPTKE